jgi:hypothetical protein
MKNKQLSSNPSVANFQHVLSVKKETYINLASERGNMNRREL